MSRICSKLALVAEPVAVLFVSVRQFSLRALAWGVYLYCSSIKYFVYRRDILMLAIEQKPGRTMLKCCLAGLRTPDGKTVGAVCARLLAAAVSRT